MAPFWPGLYIQNMTWRAATIRLQGTPLYTSLYTGLQLFLDQALLVLLLYTTEVCNEAISRQKLELKQEL